MDPIATLLLARTHTVVLDADRVASAATRPARDTDVDRFEDELLQLGFVMSLDLAMTIRRLPHETLRELTPWILTTLGRSLAGKPRVPLSPLPAVEDPYGAYARRATTWLVTRAEQPCPWCGRVSPAIGALDPCGHLVCRACWTAGNYTGCSICHRRVRSLAEPFVRPSGVAARVEDHDGALRVVHLALDLEAVVKARFERLVAQPAPLGTDDREELESVIDSVGPKAALWLPRRIPQRETMAIAVARLWIVAPDRVAMMKATHQHLATATDILRVAAVLMKANPSLAEPMRLASVPRGMRRAILEALERLPLELAIEDMRRRRGLWKRVGERLHPGERKRLPNVAAAFAAVRSSASRVTWHGAVDAKLGAGDARGAATQLAERPDELARRVDHLARVAVARQPDAVDEVFAALREAAPRCSPEVLLQLDAHVARGRADRRVIFPAGDPLRAWSMPETRAPLPSDVALAIHGIVRGGLLARAATLRNYARAVIDRRLDVVRVGLRGSELALDELPPCTLEHFDERWQPAPAQDARHAVAVDGNLVRHVIDLTARRALRIDVRCDAPPTRGMLARLARDVIDATHARPTLWDVAAIHAAARANTIYVRDPASIATYKRREGETHLQRLARLHAGEHDGASKIPPANAPTWFALAHEDLALPAGSDGFPRIGAAELVAQLGAKP